MSISGCESSGEDGSDSDSGSTVGGGPGAVNLTWNPPTEREDGSALADIAGYRVYYGLQPGTYPDSVTVLEPGISAYTLEGLDEATYYFAVTALTQSGQESAFSNEAMKAVTAD